MVNAGYQYVSVQKEACFFDNAMSFAIIRGGHVDVTVLGALEVDGKGNQASHLIPGKMMSGMGGAMDLVVGTKKVIVATTHCKKNGKSSIVERLSLPATAINKVKLIVTELAVFRVTPDGLMLEEIAPQTTVDEVRACTEAVFFVSKDLKPMQSI